MSPNSFEFTVTIPADAQLLGAARLLATQAAGYAKLPPNSGAELAAEVERAADAAMTSTRAHDAPIEFVFSGDANGVTVRVSCEAAATSERPRSFASDEGVSVDWTMEGSRQVCHIRQRLPA